MSYSIYLVCTRCPHRRVLSIRHLAEAARDEFRQFVRRPRPRCPECGDAGTEIELRDPYNRVLRVG